MSRPLECRIVEIMDCFSEIHFSGAENRQERSKKRMLRPFNSRVDIIMDCFPEIRFSGLDNDRKEPK